MRSLVLLALVLSAGCTADGRTVAPARSAPTCDRLVRVGAPITGDLLLDGCRSSNGRRIAIDHYPCRGTGNVVALVQRDGRAWSGEVALGWEEQPRRGRTYGTWRGGFRYDPSVDSGFDAAGCLVTVPDLPTPSGP